jgi:hypothetical protein
LQVHGNFDLQNIHAIAVFGELAHRVGYDLGFQRGELRAFIFQALFVADQFEEERDVVGVALVADALGPSVLVVVDLGVVEGRVVEQDLDAVGTGFFQAAHRPNVEQIGQTSRQLRVIASLFVGQQKARAFGSALGRPQAPLGIKQDRAGVLGQYFGHIRLEFGQTLVVGAGSQGLLERTTLVHGGGGNHATLVRNVLHSLNFSGSKFHGKTSLGASRLLIKKSESCLTRIWPGPVT